MNKKSVNIESVNKKEKINIHNRKELDKFNQDDTDNIINQENMNSNQKKYDFLKKKRLLYDNPISPKKKSNQKKIKKVSQFDFLNNVFTENDLYHDYNELQETFSEVKVKTKPMNNKIQKIRNKIENLKFESQNRDQEYERTMKNYLYVIKNRDNNINKKQVQDRKMNTGIKSRHDTLSKDIHIPNDSVTNKTDNSWIMRDSNFHKPNKLAFPFYRNNLQNEKFKRTISSNTNLNLKLDNNMNIASEEKIYSSQNFNDIIDCKNNYASSPNRYSNLSLNKKTLTTNLEKIKIPSNNISNKDHETSLFRASSNNKFYENSSDSKYSIDMLNPSYSYNCNTNNIYTKHSPNYFRFGKRASSNSLKGSFLKEDNEIIFPQKDSILGNKYRINPSFQMNLFYSKYNQNKNREEDFVINKKPECIRLEKENVII